MTVEVRSRQRRKINATRLRQLAERALAIIDADGDSLSIVLVSDRQMAALNLQYHHTAGPTDILTFDYGGGQGELVISVDRAISQARRFHTTPARELALYVVHGILHLHGFEDRTPAQRRRMRTAERRLLARARR